MKLKKKFLILTIFTAISSFASNIYFIADTKPYKEANLYMKGSGIVNNVHKEIGDIIKTDDLLISLDSSNQKIKVDINKTELQISKDNMLYATEDYKRYSKVKKNINIDVFNTYKRKFNSSKNDLSIAENNLRESELLLKDMSLYAPFDGIITSKNVEVGQSVLGLQSKLYTVIDNSKSKLIIKFDQMHLDKVKVGDKISYRLDNDKEYSQVVINKIYPSILDNRKVEAEVIIDYVAPNLFGEGFILQNNSSLKE